MIVQGCGSTNTSGKEISCWCILEEKSQEIQSSISALLLTSSVAWACYFSKFPHLQMWRKPLTG